MNRWYAWSPEQRWSAGLGAALAVVVALVFWPILWPQPRVPTVTQTALPAVRAPEAVAAAAAPVRPRTASVQPLISGVLNLNTATPEQLEALPKVGPALAARIISARPLRSMADLDAVSGIGESTLKALAPLVSF